jgi:hypothetical protein
VNLAGLCVLGARPQPGVLDEAPDLLVVPQWVRGSPSLIRLASNVIHRWDWTGKSPPERAKTQKGMFSVCFLV